MEEQLDRVVSSSTPAGATEERMLRADLVQEMVARAQRGEGAIHAGIALRVPFASRQK